MISEGVGYNSLSAVGSSSYINNIGTLDPDNLLRLPKLHIEENTFCLIMLEQKILNI